MDVEEEEEEEEEGLTVDSQLKQRAIIKQEEKHPEASPERVRVFNFKGNETSNRDNTRSFPFFNELHALFTERATNTPQTPFDPEAGSSQSKSRKRVARTDSYQSLEEILEDEDEYEDQPRKKPVRGKQPQTSNIDKPATPKPSNSGNNSIQEILHDFFQQQKMIDM
ncbi:uncharacterized protein LOC110920251 [Helianthus annuus]|uniref:uncharacterized protein LOC110920251 n=1 Tax=Helianthus annuus TaxID=4232 RepID=UPI001652D6FC|nr:uncharacterized protein LOC110920251 [Helianthus annuus]